MAIPKPKPKTAKAVLKGSKAAPGPSKASAERAANIGAYHAGKNYTAKGVSRTGYQPARPAATPAPPRQSRPAFEGAFQAADILNRRGTNAFGQKKRQ